ncbi:DUF4902 domain-containing protein [Ramlibacter sp.]|uniref:DUF4902 domain-containing protein n=1 Tax=Ramlibacter sp. TaxID=1917967 RepID=UPI0017AFA158|nr:DUF4902 domain-containing protein [Ramlibacter sp.]MBA2674457.1 DUF4902 domain-containing protein [Ramlibacter sp.]
MNFALRFPASELVHMRLDHLDSGIDVPEFEPFAQGAQSPSDAPESTGYTEWIGAANASISVGWDWFVSAGIPLLTLRAGTIRTNLMLTDARGVDLGREATLQRLDGYLRSWAWQPAVLQHLHAQGGTTASAR